VVAALAIVALGLGMLIVARYYLGRTPWSSTLLALGLERPG
jgi:hypothetical protein